MEAGVGCSGIRCTSKMWVSFDKSAAPAVAMGVIPQLSAVNWDLTLVRKLPWLEVETWQWPTCGMNLDKSASFYLYGFCVHTQKLYKRSHKNIPAPRISGDKVMVHEHLLNEWLKLKKTRSWILSFFKN